MRLGGAFTRLLMGAALVGLTLAQDPPASSSSLASRTSSRSPSSQSATQSGSAAASSATRAPSRNSSTAVAGALITTTTVVPNENGEGSQTFVLTLTVPQANSTASSAPLAPSSTASVGLNGTLSNNGTLANGTMGNETTPWNDTLGYLPFTPQLDAAYGVGGALLIITGIPVATLGGKNRWSALALISGYTVGVFCLVMVMSFGVTPALQGPSPHPPTSAMRGLYLLAVTISFLVGSGLGVFFYTFAKYWVGAAGGFALGWFILALRKGGVVHSVGPRWAIIGSLTVVGLLAALVPFLNQYVLLVASAFIGATAFTLGIDCFTRVGLKEFYMYNLGYTNLFPSLNGGQFPLTQSMQVELGVIAAAALIAGAIQFKVVTMLQTRRKRLVEEEEAKIEAVEISRAAELFKNVDAELAEWEGKYGGKSDSGTETLADTLQMGKGMPRSMSSAPTTPGIDSPSIESRNLNLTPIIDTPRRLSLMEEMGYKEDPKVDPELEQKVQLLAEVRRARQSIRSSMDYLRSVGTTPLDPAAASGSSDGPHSDRPGSPSSSRILDRGRYDSGSSSLMLLNVGSTERPRKNSLGPNLEASTVGSVIGSRLSLADVGRMASSPEGRPQSDNRPLTEWEQYLDSRTVVSPPPVSPPTSNLERYSVVSNSVSRAVTQRADRAPSAGQEYGANLARAIGASEATAAAAAATNPLRSPGPMGSTSRRASKAMTTEEFAERHQKMLTKMQDRVSAPIKEEQALVVAKSEWDEKKRLEREEQRRRAQRTEREGMVDGRPPRHADRTRRTEEWRRSVAVSPPPSPNLSTAQRSTAPAPAPATPRQQVQRRDSRPVA